MLRYSQQGLGFRFNPTPHKRGMYFIEGDLTQYEWQFQFHPRMRGLLGHGVNLIIVTALIPIPPRRREDCTRCTRTFTTSWTTSFNSTPPMRGRNGNPETAYPGQDMFQSHPASREDCHLIPSQST